MTAMVPAAEAEATVAEITAGITAIIADRTGPVHTLHNKETTMKSSTRDQAEGTFHEVKGILKQFAGKLSDNPELQAEGAVEKIAGKVQEKIGQAKKVLGK